MVPMLMPALYQYRASTAYHFAVLVRFQAGCKFPPVDVNNKKNCPIDYVDLNTIKGPRSDVLISGVWRLTRRINPQWVHSYRRKGERIIMFAINGSFVCSDISSCYQNLAALMLIFTFLSTLLKYMVVAALCINPLRRPECYCRKIK